MAQLIVRNLEQRVKAGLLRRAKRHGWSMEEEVRTILRKSVLRDGSPKEGLGSRMKARFAGIGLDRPLEMPKSGKVRAPRFEE